MIYRINTDRLDCLCCRDGGTDRIAYILYPMDILSGWIEHASARHGTAIAVITGMDWDNDLTPWPAKGVPKGSPDFKGKSSGFLARLQRQVIPAIEKSLGIAPDAERTLIGTSLSGLFAMWQWLECDTFRSIASLSGSFWYDGFAGWVAGRAMPVKQGLAYFLLGESEPKTKVKAFASVGRDTADIISALSHAGIRTEFESVPGNHYSDPVPRLEKAMTALYPARP